MRRIPPSKWPAVFCGAAPVQVWRDLDFLCLEYQVPEHPNHLRLTVVRAAGVGINGSDRVVYRDGITWDDLQRVKQAVGYGDRWAVEVFPADPAVVDVANMRHLWVLPSAPSFAWNNKGET